MATDNRRPARPKRDVHGILLLDKPLGMSSNAALQRVRYLLRAKKGGHTGSLDPLASGMLPLCFGDATRFSHALLDADKAYSVGVSLGQTSTTGDAEGEKSERVAVPDLSLTAWQAFADDFVGDIQQVPPMYSALKHEGKRLYELARSGRHVERPSRPVTIHQLQVLTASHEALTLKVRCSKGTYIRTLVEDLAAAAGTCAWTAALRRDSVSPFDSEMISLAAIEASVDNDEPVAMLPVDAGIQHWPAMCLSDSEALHFCQGRKFVAADEAAAGRVRCYAPGGEFLGSGELDSERLLKPDRVMSAAQQALTAKAP